MKKILALVLGLVIMSGCASVDKLLTLQGLSANQDAQKRDVEAQNKQFKKLLITIKENRIQEYPTQESFIKDFGEPIYIRKITRDNQPLDQWLYRKTQQLIDAEKVYVYFDESGRFVSFEHIAPQNPTENPVTP